MSAWLGDTVADRVVAFDLAALPDFVSEQT